MLACDRQANNCAGNNGDILEQIDLDEKNVPASTKIEEDVNLVADGEEPNSSANVLAFKNIREFKDKLTNLSFDKNELNTIKNFPRNENGMLLQNPNTLMEITNLPEGYRENFVEWNGYNYTIDYQSREQMGLGILVSNEEYLQKYMAGTLAGIGTYDELKKNELILNLKRTTEKTEMGEMEIYNFDTKLLKNQKRTYIEFEFNSKNYVISNQYLPDGSLQSSLIFVFDGDNSYMIYNFGNTLSYKEIVSLSLGPIK
jgi:hypothetical protein